MDFGGLIDLLLAERRPAWLLLRSRAGRRPSGDLEDWCRDAWNLWRDPSGGWAVIRGWGAQRQEQRYDTEAEACAALLERVREQGESGVRALGLEELPPPVRRLARVAKLDRVTARPGDRLVLGGFMGLRIVETGQGHRVDSVSTVPPTAGEPWLEGLGFEDACRVVMVLAGAAIPAQPGLPRWGVPGAYRAQAEEGLRLLGGHSLERIERAYLAEPEGVLLRLAEPAAVELLTEGLLALAEARGLRLGIDGDPDAVLLIDPSASSYRLRRTAEAYELAERPERSNSWSELGGFAELAAARTALLELLLPRS